MRIGEAVVVLLRGLGAASRRIRPAKAPAVSSSQLQLFTDFVSSSLLIILYVMTDEVYSIRDQSWFRSNRTFARSSGFVPSLSDLRRGTGHISAPIN